MPYTLYASPGACSLAPHIVLEEIGRPFSLSMISTDRGDTRTPEFRNINPKGRVPVLVDGAFMLTEVPAILLHLAQSCPDAGLAPNGQDGLVRAVEWFNWLSGTVHAVAVRMIWRAENFSADPAHLDAIRQKGFEHLASAHEMIEDRLQTQTWALGEGYSIVDPYLLVFYRWGNRMKIDMRSRYPRWTDHASRMAARPAVARALATEGISLWE